MVVDQVLRSEGVDGQRGLSSAEAAGRAQRFGPNQLTAGQAEPRWHVFFRQYRDPMQLVLLVGGIGNLYPTQAADTRQYLRDEITKRNPGSPSSRDSSASPESSPPRLTLSPADISSEAAEIGYHPEDRTIRVTLPDAARVAIEALWMTSWRPPEPASTSTQVFDGELAAGSHDIVLPDRVPSEASFAAVTVGARVRVLTVGPLPDAVTRMVPKSATGRRLPDVATVTTHSDDT